jgi:hypothetical protein
MKNRKDYVMAPSNQTLTQSGLLALLLQRQHRKVIELARRRAHREQIHTAFGITRDWLSAHAHSIIAGRPFRRGFGGNVPRHI